MRLIDINFFFSLKSFYRVLFEVVWRIVKKIEWMYLDCHGMNICNHHCQSMDDNSNRLEVVEVVAALQIQSVAIINKVVSII